MAPAVFPAGAKENAQDTLEGGPLTEAIELRGEQKPKAANPTTSALQSIPGVCFYSSHKPGCQPASELSSPFKEMSIIF